MRSGARLLMPAAMTDQQAQATPGKPIEYRDPAPFSIEAQGQSLTFYPGGSDRLQALLDMIGNAQASLDLCYYMFVDDNDGRRVRDALTDAVRRGVQVRLIIDSYGSDVPDNFFDALTKEGGQFWSFSAKWSRRYLIRNHQKMAIGDGETALIGGFNVEREYFAPPHQNGWHDLGLAVEGSAVGELLRWFEELVDWVGRPRAQFRVMRNKVKNWDSGSGPVRLLIGGPTNGLSSWARCVGRDLDQGRRLDMVMAYFSPSKKLLKRIGRIAEKGETRLVMAGKSDNGATIGATRSLYDYLLRKRANIWEFRACKLHMKLLVLDDAIYVGSANFDMRSLYINLELMLRIEDAALAERMRTFVSDQLVASKQITLEGHRQKATVWNRFRWNVSWLLVGVLDYTISRRLNLGL